MPRAGSDFLTPTDRGACLLGLAPHNGRVRVKRAKGPGVYGFSMTVHNAVEVELFNQ